MDISRRETAYWAHVSADGARFQTVRQHLVGTATLAEQFAQPFGADSQTHLAGLLHDIGKYSCDFQKRLAGSMARVDHSTAGAKESWRLQQAEVAFVVAGHHGGCRTAAAGPIPRTPVPSLAGYIGMYRIAVPGMTKSICRRHPIPHKFRATIFRHRFTSACFTPV